MIFQKPQVDTENILGAVTLRFSPKSVAFNATHSVYVDIFVKPSMLSRRDTESKDIKENVWLVLNYFEVTTFDANCDFLWGETIDDQLNYDSLITVTEYEPLFDLIEQKTSMVHRKMQYELKDKITQNANVKI